MDELHEQSQRDRTEVRQVEHELSARLFRDIREKKGRGMMENLILTYMIVELEEISSTLSLIREALEEMNKNAPNGVAAPFTGQRNIVNHAKDRLRLYYSRCRQKEEAEMTEREFYISIIPELAELIVYLSYLCPADRNSVEIEMLKSCKNNPQAFKMMRKLWNTIRSQLKE